ncbi:MAG: FimB/Mfa2 family fimbrial subunit [Prevotella sp.]|nr:FimB/Mfa2 family fimbrial subunit [Bacteroides sp.]MCM1366601.1 FimB/Mfa2 family fimbrial subunit [Prevotella sp.]MCM1437302.1 FimB/Mfa2 family fimbrial subunit [Prevotella sp.]
MKKTLRNIAATATTFLAILMLATSCESIYDDDLEPCPQGLQVRFIYDYTLEGGNAFPEQVDCLTLHVYDADGNYVKSLTETTDQLKDENYRMTIDLPAGKYRLIAYGGLECDEASFLHTYKPQSGSKDHEIGLQIHPDCLIPHHAKGKLHDLFYGTLNVTVDNPVNYTECTVPMMKDTNHFRIMLQNVNYEPLDGKDYEFTIEDDNTLFDHNNDLVDNGNVTYTSWASGKVSTGIVDAETKAINEVTLAYAELSTSRLMTKRTPKLVVTHKESGKEIINLPLNNYLLAMASDRYKDKYGPQEFLDRQSNWNMVFFMLDNQTWFKTVIKVNDWDVRVNEAEW